MRRPGPGSEQRCLPLSRRAAGPFGWRYPGADSGVIVRAHHGLPALLLPINNALPSCANQQRDPLASVDSGAPIDFRIKATLGQAVDSSTYNFRVCYLVWGCGLEVG